MKTIKLNYPIEADGQTYNKLSLRRSKVKDRLAVARMKNTSDEEKEIRFFANLCEVTPSVIEELDEADYKQLSETYMDFLLIRGELHKAVIILAKITHWTLSEISNMDEEEFINWYNHAVEIEKQANAGH
jgi:hypothetical protein